jgi:signal transduction histidine kinase
MPERAELVGGRAAIQSHPGRGTTITVRVPEGADA